MKVTRWYNLLAFLWTSQFLIGCQHMVIAGAVSSWFFTRYLSNKEQFFLNTFFFIFSLFFFFSNKTDLNSPVCKSFYNLIRYHLGTVAMGSFLIAIVQLIRLLLKAVEVI